MMTLLLTLAWVVFAALVLLAFCGAGCVFPAAKLGQRSVALPLCVTALLGMGVLGTLQAILGLFHLWTPALSWAVGIAAAVRGAMFMADLARMRSRSVAPDHEKLTVPDLCALAAGILLATNMAVGALAPDSQQDSLWYHLAVARAWVEWRSLDAWPSVLPSNYVLLASSIYAVVLPVGGVIGCSVTQAVAGFLCYGLCAAFAMEWFGRRAAIWAFFLCAAGHGSSAWFVPMHTGADLITGAFSTGALLLMLYVASGRQPVGSLPLIVASGWLAGCAAAAKITALGLVVVPWTTVAIVGVLLRTVTPRQLVLGGVLAFGAFSPWLVRSLIVGCGNPFFPALADSIPMRPGFEVLTDYLITHHRLGPSPLSDLSGALSVAASQIMFLASSLSAGFILHIAVAGGLFHRSRLSRLAAVIVLLQWAVILSITARNELPRLFSITYPAAFAVLAGGVAWFAKANTISPVIRHAALLALAGLLSWTYLWKQIDWAFTESIGWKFRPVLTAEDQVCYLETKHYDLANIHLYHWMNENLPREAVVLCGNIAHPAYIERRFLWADEKLTMFHYLEDIGVASPEALRDYCRNGGVTHLLAYPTTRPAASEPWRELFEREESAARIPARAVLYRLKDGEP